MSEASVPPSLFARLAMAFIFFWRLLARPQFAQALLPYRHAPALPSNVEPSPATAPPRPVGPPPEKAHASGLFVLSMLQREGRLVDFLQEDVATFSDAEVGAAARVVHEGCRKVVRQYLTLEPVLADSEGAAVTIPPGFDAGRIRLTGNVAGSPPFKGALRHHGWVTKEVRFPAVPEAMDARVLAPAEVELG